MSSATYLLVTYAKVEQITEEDITPILLESIYNKPEGIKLFRYNGELYNSYSFAIPHKWRNKEEGGGWDDKLEWRITWQPVRKRYDDK